MMFVCVAQDVCKQVAKEDGFAQTARPVVCWMSVLIFTED